MATTNLLLTDNEAAAIVTCSVATFHRRVADGTASKPIKIGPGMARILGVIWKMWLSLKSVVMAFLDLGPEGWTQNRQLEARQDVARKVQQKRDAANARWGAKSLTDREPADWRQPRHRTTDELFGLT